MGLPMILSAETRLCTQASFGHRRVRRRKFAISGRKLESGFMVSNAVFRDLTHEQSENRRERSASKVMTENERNARPRSGRSAPATTVLALARTVLASDRTLLAWIRTSLSMMTFGFTIYKFFHYLYKSGAFHGDWDPAGARHFGVTLITLATVMLTWQTVNHYRVMRRLSRARGKKLPITPTLAAGGAVSTIGMVAMIDILFDTGLY